jgi:hypothetical protein
MEEEHHHHHHPTGIVHNDEEAHVYGEPLRDEEEENQEEENQEEDKSFPKTRTRRQNLIIFLFRHFVGRF